MGNTIDKQIWPGLWNIFDFFLIYFPVHYRVFGEAAEI